MSDVKVTLAVPYGDKKADSTVTLPKAEAAELLHTGRARLAPKSAKTDDK